MSEQNKNLNKKIEIMKRNQTNSRAEKYNTEMKNSLEGVNSRSEQGE